jgi:tripartite-type tricarboxylate transporter receptor subunit TctC
MRKKRLLVTLLLLSACGLPAGEARSQSPQFYKDKQITLIAGAPVGGSYDTYARLVARHLGEHVPGKPAVIVQNMPGAVSIRAANHLYAAAPKDGLVIGTFNNALAFYQVVGGQPGIQYRSEELSWIGSIPQDAPVVVAWHTAGVKSIDDVKRTEVIMGTAAEAGMMTGYPALLNAALGTRFKLVFGYNGSAAIKLAMERGEVQGLADNTWPAYIASQPEWVRGGKIVPLVQIGPRKDPLLPEVPLLTDLAATAEQRAMFEFVGSVVALGQPFAGPPGMAPERLAELRLAFSALGQDAAFRADFAKAYPGSNPELLSGAAVEGIVKATIATPPALVEKTREAITVKEPAKPGTAP